MTSQANISSCARRGGTFVFDVEFEDEDGDDGDVGMHQASTPIQQARVISIPSDWGGRESSIRPKTV